MEEKKDNRKKRHGAGFFVRILVLAAAAAVFCYAAFQLYGIFHGYQAATDEYDSLKNSYTAPYSAPDVSAADSQAPDVSAPEDTSDAAENELIEDADPPLSVNFAALQEVNSDVNGWLYIDAQPSISYPICRGTDNDFYLHHTFEKAALFAGSIFEDYHNSADFSDPNSIVYGHNMKNQSMFGLLKTLRKQETYDANPYFWILTPGGSYRYHIFAAFETPVDSAAYQLYSAQGSELLAWAQEMQKNSEVKNSVPLSGNDKIVMLSTCTSDSSTRCVVLGKCVSTERP
jgi:sortase B